jgi:hypothetical protein
MTGDRNIRTVLKKEIHHFDGNSRLAYSDHQRSPSGRIVVVDLRMAGGMARKNISQADGFSAAREAVQFQLDHVMQASRPPIFETPSIPGRSDQISARCQIERISAWEGFRESRELTGCVLPSRNTLQTCDARPHLRPSLRAS